MDLFYRKECGKGNGYNQTQCLKMFGCSKSGYHAWRSRKEDRNGKAAAAAEEETRIMECMKAVIRKRGYVPGKRTFHTDLWRDHELHVSVKRCRRLMIRMNLTANCPKKDPYNHQASHDHACASPENKVNQNFYIGPRRVTLTDITYLYYGLHRAVFYLCAFKDAFTKEILGYAVSERMDTALVKTAFDRMMEQHGKEFPVNTDVWVHSDQGSQYMSATFRQLLNDNEFIQSVSGRGNSQDNAPMESFFGRMKTHIMDLIALAPDCKTAERLVSGYIDRYNNEFCQYNLAGLTPAEFYRYKTTGIYPLDNYFGVGSTELISVNDLVAERQRRSEEKNAKAREAYARKNEERNRLHKSPIQIVIRDQNMLRRMIREWEESKDRAENQIAFLKSVLEKTDKAAQFINSLPAETEHELYIPQNWQKYPELDYIYDMKGLF